ncbi:uncharacterized protein BJ171DRAFT_477232 [Polychytrium aggregatum]|uniref:uncharacterized protein n=1 Tax=Polychytrium aggregatum TaxID=110093 RepID=UPI0022FEDC98|nr:uncharacterized protein BJ171DRAFT_477232 [Polychytrium aggregatum]KAI9199785.1 hypothetical protein BJ171DRAFT_477232 [Polychytrium aggregatum]
MVNSLIGIKPLLLGALCVAPLALASPYKCVASPNACQAADAAPRVDCGNVTTTVDECVASGCCWGTPPANQPNGPYCFFSSVQLLNPAACPATPIDASDRTDCGYFGINQGQCVQKGCCWAPLSNNATGPW